MSDQKNMHSQDDNVRGEDSASSAESSVASSRRRVLLAGGAGAILASMKSGSALAGGVCSSPSAFGSIAVNHTTSQHPHTYTCTAHSHGYYGSTGVSDDVRTTRWSPIDWRTATLAITGLSSAGHWQMNTLLYEILKAPSTIGWNPDGNMIVLWLDVQTGSAGNALTLADVKAMWDILFSGSTSDPKFAGWTAQTVVDFYNSWVGPN